ncbi:hypothetical protein PBY51_001588 [Eleginops maclovinus]|uniref:Uncharacterized protein n=1 Tax=Eleginops maclovinus TaxID=56733 RepID=A0AAN8A0D4_ELEMC|nr:hypothetical protein PBY51_001588 [Eleginops maclovinus]
MLARVGAPSSRKASESSQAASYLALVGARTQEWTCHRLLPVNKPNTVGTMRCEAEDAAVSRPCLPLRPAPAHQPPDFFLLCQREIKYQPPSFDVLNS